MTSLLLLFIIILLYTLVCAVMYPCPRLQAIRHVLLFPLVGLAVWWVAGVEVTARVDSVRAYLSSFVQGYFSTTWLSL